MRFERTPLAGVWTIELELLEDERGWFARAFDTEEFMARGLELEVAQGNLQYTPRAGTLRGMHYQRDPHGEPKLVRCIRGATHHVVVDLRPGSPTHGAWHGVGLSPESRRALYVPPGLAHGSQTLVDDCEVFYLMGHRHVPEAACGVRWDDPAFAIDWPAPPGGGERIVSARDRAYPDYPL
ncbi:MAG TPA: dTDP-4-dehydrorhamnose 3,5-epimerase family protein [Solirubrobacteraceae bacterium]|jgi:dTDP-4-dehydrorhamnose 3,5-epimerase|nr:dTDP-4-dehydrorhamnose 3,5-epimerase family protein [Solirubrobacteraceae bacterium]